MNREYLENYVQSVLPMPPDKATFLAEQFEYVEMSKNEIFLREGTISRNTYVLQSGFIRSFTNDQSGDEVTTNIFSAPSFVNDFLSFFKQEPTSENFQCLTECQVWTMSYEKVQMCFHSYPEFREFGRMMLVMNYSRLHERMLGMIKDSAEARYLSLVNRHPHLIQNVSLKVIASYLGVTDTSLSRIRKELSTR